ncbi:hypothetical protein GCM10027297_27300 [Parahaliea aestuarii]
MVVGTLRRASLAVATLSVMLVAGLLQACGGDSAGNNAGNNAGGDEVTWIEGTVIYRERMRLPPNASVEVELQDISRADAPAETLATVALPGDAGPPYAFRIEYDNKRIDARHRYALRAEIHAGGKLLFTSTEHIDPFGDAPIEILVSRVPEPVAVLSPDPAASPGAVLEGTHWLLQSLDGEAVDAGAGGKPLDLLLDAQEQRASGFSGCNRFNGGYSREGSSGHGAALRFGPLAGTLMACAEGTGLERRYLDALGVVDNFRISAKGQLELAAGTNVVAVFSTAQ